MNENRANNWLTEDQLLRGTEEFFELNHYSNIEYNKILDEGGSTFSSLIAAYKTTKYDEGEQIGETIVSIFKSKIKQYDLSFFGFIESILFNIMDNYELTNLMLVTDSLSYFHILKKEEISVAVENMIREGLFVLFLTHRSVLY